MVILSVVCLELSLDKASCLSLWGEKEMVQRETFDAQLEGKGKEKASLWEAVNGFPSGSKRHLVSLYNTGSELSQAKALQVNINVNYEQNKTKHNSIPSTIIILFYRGRVADC